jgi:hypothetical protein
MLAISEDGAQKRVARSLGKLRYFLSKRGVKVSGTVLAGLLATQFAQESVAATIPALLPAAKSGASGSLATTYALKLADRAMRLSRRQAVLRLGAKLGLIGLLILGGSWGWMEHVRPPRSTAQAPDPRIEALAKRWSDMVLGVAAVMAEVARIPPGDARFQTLLTQVNSLTGDAIVIRDELNALLTPSRQRDQVAEFLTSEITQTLKLDPPEQRAVYSFVRERLGRGATLVDAMKAMAQDIPAESVQIKTLLSPTHQQDFDSIYHANGSGFWVFLKIATDKK